MAQFSKFSKSNLKTCHPDLQKIFNEVILAFDCRVLCGERDEYNQNKAVEDGYSQLRYPKSKHNKIPSMAADVVPYPIDWQNKERFIYFAGIVKGIAYELYKEKKITHWLTWGGDWDDDEFMKDHKFLDYPHFQLTKIDNT